MGSNSSFKGNIIRITIGSMRDRFIDLILFIQLETLICFSFSFVLGFVLFAKKFIDIFHRQEEEDDDKY